MKKHTNITQGTEAWHQLRKGKITGTTLKALMGTPKARQEALYEVIAERLTVGVDMDYENAMDRGLRLEPDAIAVFEMESDKKVTRLGYAESDDNELIGYSPDGVISDEEDVEVKCLNGKNHVKMWLTDEIPDEYGWQVVQAFVVNPKLQTRYFIGYNPDIPAHPLHVIKAHRQDYEGKIQEAQIAQDAFLHEVEGQLSKIISI